MPVVEARAVEAADDEDANGGGGGGSGCGVVEGGGVCPLAKLPDVLFVDMFLGEMLRLVGPPLGV